MMYEIKMKILFKVREFVWVIVSEIEDWVYPYRTRLTEEEKYEHGMKDPMTGEITMIENLLQADNERIQRLQDEMINAQTRLYVAEPLFKISASLKFSIASLIFLLRFSLVTIRDQSRRILPKPTYPLKSVGLIWIAFLAFS